MSWWLEFRLVVENPAGAQATRDVRVPIAGPQTFRPTRSVPVDPSRREHAAVLLADGRVLLAGGRGDAGLLDTTEIFDPATESFTAGPRLLAARFDPAAAPLPDGRALVVGGFDDKPGHPFRLLGAEILDPVAGTAVSAGDLPATDAVLPQAIALRDGRVLVFHGSLGQGAELYDPTTGTFTPVDPPQENVACVALAPLADGRVLVVAGLGGASALFTSAPPSFAPTASVASERCYYVVALLPDGRVLVVGGAYPAEPYDRTEAYDPARGAFVDVEAPLPHVSELRGASLADGHVLVAGGLRDGWASPEARLFDAAANAFRDTGGLTCPRRFHTLTALRDGRALVAGGCSASGPDLVGAEIYTP